MRLDRYELNKNVIDKEIVVCRLAVATVVINAVTLGIVRGTMIDPLRRLPFNFHAPPGSLVAIEQPHTILENLKDDATAIW